MMGRGGGGGLLVCLLHALAYPAAVAYFRGKAQDLPAAVFMPSWISLPSGEAPDWELIHRTLECRIKMDRELARVVSPCSEGDSQDPVCRMRVSLISLHAGQYTMTKANENRYEFAAHANALKDKYCQRWQFCTNTVLMDPTFDDGYKANERHPAWHKVLAVRAELLKGECDWYMWLDGDAAFIDHSLDLRYLIASKTDPRFKGNQNKTFLVSRDIWSTPGDGGSNTGVWIIRNGSESVAMMDRWWDSANQVKAIEDKKKHAPWEQFAFNTDIYPTYEDQIERLDECWLFGHPLTLVDKPFIAHMCGFASSNKQSERLMYFSFWRDRWSKCTASDGCM